MKEPEPRLALEQAAAEAPPQILGRSGAGKQLVHARPVAPRITVRDLDGQPRIATARRVEEGGEIGGLEVAARQRRPLRPGRLHGREERRQTLQRLFRRDADRW